MYIKLQFKDVMISFRLRKIIISIIEILVRIDVSGPLSYICHIYYKYKGCFVFPNQILAQTVSKMVSLEMSLF